MTTYPTDDHSRARVGTPDFIVIVRDGVPLAAHHTAHAQGVVVARGLTFDEALADAEARRQGRALVAGDKPERPDHA